MYRSQTEITLTLRLETAFGIFGKLLLAIRYACEAPHEP
jgi:hypothetical protein